MRKTYLEPEIIFIEASSSDILSASDEEVFVDGGDLFD